MLTTLLLALGTASSPAIVEPVSRKVRRQFHNSCSLKGRIGGTCMNVEGLEVPKGMYQEAQYSGRRAWHPKSYTQGQMRRYDRGQSSVYGRRPGRYYPNSFEAPEAQKPWQEARKAKCRALTVGLRCAG